MVIIATIINVPTKDPIMFPIRLLTPIAAFPAAIPFIKPIMPYISPKMTATEARANDAATTGMDVISFTVPAGANNSFTPPTLGIM